MRLKGVATMNEPGTLLSPMTGLCTTPLKTGDYEPEVRLATRTRV